jgi:hypothetical protein
MRLSSFGATGSEFESEILEPFQVGLASGYFEGAVLAGGKFAEPRYKCRAFATEQLLYVTRGW